MKLRLRTEELNRIDFSSYKKYNLDIGNRYFYMEAGREHYRLLAHIAKTINEAKYPNGFTRSIDIGTNHGCSALALSDFGMAEVVSYDVVNNRKDDLSGETNVKFKLENLQHQDCSFFKNFDIVFLDANKNDDFEWWICQQCIDSNFAGYLILDDYLEYPVVRACVTKLKILGWRAYDLTKYGHYSGTHLIDFSNKLEVECQ